MTVMRAISTALWMAIQAVLLLLLLAVLMPVLSLAVSVSSVTHASGQIMGDVGVQAGQVVSGAGQTLQQFVNHFVIDASDPTAPPTNLTSCPLGPDRCYDTKFSAIDTWQVGDGLPGGSNYVVTLSSVDQLDGADSPDTAHYAVFHAELRQPHETRILGILVHSDSDSHDHYVYTGEAFRLGQTTYRMNWIEPDTVGAGVVRSPDAVMLQTLKFDYP